MDLGSAGLNEQPFPTHGKPLATLGYKAEQDAIDALRETREHANGLLLLQGPSLSGKSTILRTWIESLPPESSVALIDGKGLNTTNLLVSVLRQYGYDVDLSSANELLGLVRVFALQQAAAHEPPILIIENVLDMNPSALRVLCELAELRVRNGSAIKMVLCDERQLKALTEAQGMSAIGRRVLHDLHLRPMTAEESRGYLHAKLKAAGSDYPEFVFPEKVCAELHSASGGWPGILDRVALLALARADTLPVACDHIEHPTLPSGTWDESMADASTDSDAAPSQPPLLVVTNNGSVMQEITMSKARVLVGRSEHNDVAITSRFVSRHHALFVRHGAATFLMDLNSTNGTYVNAQRVSNHVLKHEDVVTIGHHKIKFYDPYATVRGSLDGDEFADTAIMKTLQDMRELLAQENTALMPIAASEDLPTIQT